MKKLLLACLCAAISSPLYGWSLPVALNTGTWTSNALWQAQMYPAASGGVHVVFLANSLPRYVRLQNSLFGTIRNLPGGSASDVCEAGDGSVYCAQVPTAGYWDPTNIVLQKSTNGGVSWLQILVRQAPDLGVNNREANLFPLVAPCGAVGTTDIVCTWSLTYQERRGVAPDDYWGDTSGHQEYYRYFDGSSWTAYQTIAGVSGINGRYGQGTMFRSLQNNSIYRVYIQTLASTWQFAMNRWNGSGWDAKQVLFTSSVFASSASMAISPSGKMIVCYTTDVMKYRAYTPGVGWSAEANVGNSSVNGKVAGIPGTDDFLIAYWKGFGFTNSQIYVKRYSNGLTAETSIVPSAAFVHIFSDLRISSNGDVYVAYAKKTSTTADTWQLNVVTDPAITAGRGTLAGKVTDQYGASIPNAIVQSGTYSTAADSAGNYSLSIGEGVQNVTASKPYYTSQTINGIVITVGQTTPQNFAITANPPGLVTAFNAVPASGALRLGWTAPSSGNFAGTLIRFSTTAYPANPTAGQQVCRIDASPSSANSFKHSGLTNGSLYYYSAFSYDADGHYSGAVNLTGSPRPVTIGDCKTMAEGSITEMTDKVVSAIYSSDGCFYIQEADRSSGIRVSQSGIAFAVGDRVSIANAVVGTYSQSGVGAERQITGTVTKTSSGTAPTPVIMSCKTVGGESFYFSKGVTEGNGELGTGLNNIGLLAKVTGRVTMLIGAFIYLDDGSDIYDIFETPSYRIGVLVKCPTTPSYNIRDLLSVTGVIRGSVPSGWSTNRRYIVCRTTADLQPL
ncbi:MAG: carboxypeptidase-like regulatory domain-containing protein [Armatimonadota bacterium]